MHKKQLYLNISIYLFFTGGVRTCKNFTFKLIIQRLLQLYNIDISYGLTKTNALLMASTCKIAFNIDGLIIHSSLNILV